MRRSFFRSLRSGFEQIWYGVKIMGDRNARLLGSVMIPLAVTFVPFSFQGPCAALNATIEAARAGRPEKALPSSPVK